MDAIAGMAEAAALEGEGSRAAELLAFVVQHPFTAHDARRRASARLHELQDQLPPNAFAAAVERAVRLDLEALATALHGAGDRTRNREASSA